MAVFIVLGSFATHAAAVDPHQLVHTEYYEGIPFALAQELDDEGVAALATWLADPNEKPAHAMIVTALGMSGRASAVAVLVSFADLPPTGLVDDDTYRARFSLPVALGHLARSNPSLLPRLIASARDATPSAAWYTQRLNAPRLAAMLRRRAASGLAVAGSVAARTELVALLATAEAANPADAEWIAHLQASKALCERVAADGAAAVFGDQAP